MGHRPECSVFARTGRPSKAVAHSGRCSVLGGFKMTAALKLIHGENRFGKKDYINRGALAEPKTGVLFTEFIEKTVARKQKRMKQSYSRNYKTLLYHLQNFTDEFDVNIYTNSVNEEFLDDFITSLEEKELKLGYINYLLVLIKGMVKKAAIYGYAVDPSFDDVQVKTEETFSVYLSMNEITRLYYYENLTRIQKKWRDLFVLGCLTGLRYSDYSTLDESNFQGDFIVKTTKKTGTKVVIPVHDYIREIIARYHDKFPAGLSTQQFNRHLKNIGRKVGFNEPVINTYTKGREVITESKPKWQYISSHTARRSFATNMYLTGRMKTHEIMAITGHTTERSFFRYIKVTQEDTIKQIAGDTFFRK